MSERILVFYGSYRSNRMGIRLADYCVRTLQARDQPNGVRFTSSACLAALLRQPAVLGGGGGDRSARASHGTPRARAPDARPTSEWRVGTHWTRERWR